MTSILDFPGVDPTGATDSLTGLMAAIASWEPLTVPEGTYLIDGTLTLRSGLSLKGCGPNSIFKHADGAAGDVLYVNGAMKLTIEDIAIDGNHDRCPGGQSNLYTIDSTFMVLSRVESRAGRLYGFRLWNADYSLISACRVSYAGYTGMRIAGTDGAVRNTGLRILGNSSFNNGGDSPGFGTPGIGISLAYGSRCIIASNTVHGNKTNGLDVNFSSATVVSGNVSFNNGVDGLAVDGNSAEEGNCDDTIVVGNQLQANGHYGLDLAYYTRNCIFRDNNLRGNTLGAKLLQDSAHRTGCFFDNIE